MGFDVSDFRRPEDVRNIVIRPDIRSRFLRMEPGEVGPRHSHDLGQEVFLVLAGQCEFEIEGDVKVLGPGEFCFAAANELHQVRVIGDEPMTMYLSVTPHIEPTHTWWSEDGTKLAPRYGAATANERAGQPAPALAELLTQHAAVSAALATVATVSAAAQVAGAEAVAAAAAAGDQAAVKAAVDAMWEQLRPVYEAVQQLGVAWNEIAAQAQPESGA